MASIPSYKDAVIERFSARAHVYEQNARLQAEIADRLARSLPHLEKPDILEVGCGTGLLTRHLLAAYPDGEFQITDLSQTMLDLCAARSGTGQNLQYRLMDGEHPDLTARYDLIATSMTAQWFNAADESLMQLQSLLKPGGHLLYSTIGSNLFPQWRAVLEELGYPCGLVDVPDLPGVITEDYYKMRFENGIRFLQSLKSTGASHPRPGYHSLSVRELRHALRLFETRMNCCCDWHILFGHLRG